MNNIHFFDNRRILKFSGDTRLFNHVDNTEDVLRLRKDLGNVRQWSADWLMLFNVDIGLCMVMHFGHCWIYNNTSTSCHNCVTFVKV